MLKKLFTLAVLASPTFGSPGHAQAPSEFLDYAGRHWRIAAQEARIVSHLGRDAISLARGGLWTEDVDFTDGVISFDVAHKEETVFIGARWRVENDGHFEEMYFRGHLNNKPDALQYTPVENGLAAWQIFSDGNAIAPVAQKYGEWNHVKIVVEGDRADIYFNSDAPVLHVPDLKTTLREGGVGLTAFGREASPAYFSNLIIRPLEKGEGVIGEPKPAAAPPAGLIDEWRVSSPVAEASVADALILAGDAWRNLRWDSLTAETNGVANISKLTPRPEEGADTVFVRLKIRSDRAQMKELRFGYSDRVRIYVNGKRVYFGDSTYQARDYRFLGTVGFFDSVGLDLKKGDNDVLIAVSETFGGWAWAGAIADRGGVLID